MTSLQVNQNQQDQNTDNCYQLSNVNFLCCLQFPGSSLINFVYLSIFFCDYCIFFLACLRALCIGLNRIFNLQSPSDKIISKLGCLFLCCFHFLFKSSNLFIDKLDPFPSSMSVEVLFISLTFGPFLFLPKTIC